METDELLANERQHHHDEAAAMLLDLLGMLPSDQGVIVATVALIEDEDGILVVDGIILDLGGVGSVPNLTLGDELARWLDDGGR